MTESKSLRMTKTLDPVGEIREVLIAATDMVPVGEEPYVGWSAVLADRIAAALGLLDMDEFVRRLHEGYFDDDGPSAVEYACMRQAVEYAFSATEGSQKSEGSVSRTPRGIGGDLSERSAGECDAIFAGGAKCERGAGHEGLHGFRDEMKGKDAG